MRYGSLIVVFAGAALALTGCHRTTANTTAAAPAAAQQIAWREGDVDDALAEAKESGKPVLLYWSAVWCPPCARLKSTLFKDPAFIAETRDFVPVHLDGDTKGAQDWGERFGIAGYPTVIIVRPDLSEITRLSSASAAGNLAQVLATVARRTTSSADLLRKAADPTSLSADDWSVLANYDWGNDSRHLADTVKANALLDGLAAAAPSPPLRRRFLILALTNLAPGEDKPKLDDARRAAAVAALDAVLASDAEVKANRLELSYGGASLLEAAVPDAAARAPLAARLVVAMDRVYADRSLPAADRLVSVRPQLQLARDAAGPKGTIPPAVLAKVRERAAGFDRAITAPLERQSLVSDAAELLDDAGDRPAATRLLTAELKRSTTPYYYMGDLAGIAEENKDNAAAIGWWRRAYDDARGPATRVQWALFYAGAVLRLAPADAAAVERAATQVIAELGASHDGYSNRTRTKVAKWGSSLAAWSKAHDGAAVIQRLDRRMAGFCATQGDPAAAAACRDWRATA